MPSHDLSPDLDEIIEWSAGDIRAFTNARLFITGGTGFIGSWLLESIRWANLRLGTRIRAAILSRDPDAFKRRFPHFAAEQSFEFIRGDVGSPLAIREKFDGIVHAATHPADAPADPARPFAVIDVAVNGMRTVLDLCHVSGGVPLLFTSSGAVYGKQPASLALVEETYSGAPDPSSPSSAYGEGKRMSELLCSIASSANSASARIARLFAFIGPYIPLDRQFAAGNFIADALRGGPIVVQGDGTTVRSYLYATDMTAWLWAVFARGQAGRPYNIGSDRETDIASLAAAIAAPDVLRVEIRQGKRPGAVPSRYIPSVERIRSELGVAQRVSLEDAIRRTLSFYRRDPQRSPA